MYSIESEQGIGSVTSRAWNNLRSVLVNARRTECMSSNSFIKSPRRLLWLPAILFATQCSTLVKSDGVAQYERSWWRKSASLAGHLANGTDVLLNKVYSNLRYSGAIVNREFGPACTQRLRDRCFQQKINGLIVLPSAYVA